MGSIEEINNIESELIEVVYRENTQKYQQEYEQKLAQEGFPLSPNTISELNRLEKALGLGSFQFPDCLEPVSIKEELTKPFYKANLQAYSKEYKHKLDQFGVNFSHKNTAELEKLRGHFGFDICYLESLGLQALFNIEEINNIESELIELVYRENLQSYEQEYKRRLDEEGFVLSYSTIGELTHLEEMLGLGSVQIQDCSDVKSIRTKLIKPFYQLNLQNYSQEYKGKLYQQGLDFAEKHKFDLEKLRSNFGFTYTHLKNLDILGQFFPLEADLFAVEQTAKELFYAENLEYYVQEIKKAIESNLYFADQDSKLKESLQTLGIRIEDIKIVEGLVRNNWEIEHLFNERDSDASYWKLVNSLAQCEWQKADALTRAILLKLAGASGKGLLEKEAIEKISARDVYTLDRLWVEYSKGRFGFSVQKRIFNETKQERQKFAEKVGWSDKAGLFGGVFAWKLYSKLDFTLNAPQGHMPIWGAKDQKIFADNFLHFKVWNFEECNPNSDSSVALLAYQKHYSDEDFWKKVTRFAGKAGEEVIEKVLTLFYAAKQPNIPLGVKLTIIAALGYFILPFDFISDLIPVAGWTDDLGALGAALTSAIPYITPEVKEQVKKKMKEIFGR
ncbi:GUN4 domain-containing protein [Brasilonema sp. CT11]|nr:GUN4 domain-containing protein [Brasilonema sp. CT11]